MRPLSGTSTYISFFVLAIVVGAASRQLALIPVVFVLLLIGWLIGRRLLQHQRRRANLTIPYDQFQVSGDEWDQRSSRKREERADWQ
jgi:hypothetical protein